MSWGGIGAGEEDKEEGDQQMSQQPERPGSDKTPATGPATLTPFAGGLPGSGSSRTMGELAVLAFFGAGTVFGVAALVSAYNTTTYPAAAVGLGIAAAGFSFSTALCCASIAWMLRPGKDR
jgi:hypothetical protein